MTIKKDRLTGAKHLFLIVTLGPLTLLYLTVFLVVGALAAIINNLLILFAGRAIYGESNPFGYRIYWGGNNLQAVMYGRGDHEWLPPLRYGGSNN
jgi:hypothetical protein